MKGKKTWPVSSFTLVEIKTLDAGSWKDAKFAGATVPTFQEMIDLAKDLRDAARRGEELGLNDAAQREMA